MGLVYMSSAILYIDIQGIQAIQAAESIVRNDNYDKTLNISEHYIPSVLEIFSCHNNIEKAYSVYNTLRKSRSTIDPAIQSLIHSVNGMEPDRIAMLLTNNRVFVCPPRSIPVVYQAAKKPQVTNPSLQREVLEKESILDLTDMSRSTAMVAATIQSQYLSASYSYPHLNLKDFSNVVRRIYRHGLLTIPFGAIEYSDFKRYAPLCHDYGYSRGTPIDRYYLEQFIREIRSYVVGYTLEIGGSRENQYLYGFTNAMSYKTMDMHQKPEVDITGDIHDPNSLGSNSFDSIILFNVLEHCEKPWIVVENIYNWLTKRGSVFCMVPNSQRIHRDPKDYWRILPDGMRSLFAKFPIKQLYLYGNPITTIATMMGVAAEELSSEELNSFNSEYLVATCIYACKA